MPRVSFPAAPASRRKQVEQPRVAQRQILLGHDLVAVQARKRHLRGAHQEEVVLGRPVDGRPVGGEEAGPPHRLLAHQHRRDDRREPVGLQDVHDEPDQGELHAHQRPQQVGEARARDAGGRLEVDDPRRDADLHVVARREREGRRLAHPAQLPRVVLAAVGGRILGEVGEAHQQAVALGLDLAQLRLGARELLAQAARLLLVGRAVAPGAARLAHGLADPRALRACGLHPRAQLARALVPHEHLGHGAGRAAAREVRLHPLRVGAEHLQVEHVRRLRRRWRRPRPARTPCEPPRGRRRTRRRGAAP